MVRVSSVKFNNQFRTSQDLSFLLACICETVTMKMEYYYEDITYANNDNYIVLVPNPYDYNLSLTETAGIILSEDGKAFTDTFVGDSIGIVNNAVNTLVTVTEKFDNGMIRTDYAGASGLILANHGYVFNATPFAGIRYSYNLVKQGASYNSLIDNETQSISSDVLDVTNAVVKTLVFNGIKSWQIGSATVTGKGGDISYSTYFYRQKFLLTHTFVVTPLFLADQYSDLVARIKPSYFLNADCLNHRWKLEVGRDLTNPNSLQTIEINDVKSNTGWFNERFNGQPTNYSVYSIAYTVAGLPVTKLQFDVDNTVEIIIKNTTDTPFSSGNTKYILGFNYLPESETLYQNNGRTQTQNFLFDSNFNTIGSGSVNGSNYGNAYQVVKTVTSTFTSSSEIKITAVINVGATAKGILQEGDFSRYQLWVITENHSKTAPTSDKVNLLADVNEFYYDTYTADLISAPDGIKIIQHPYVDYVDGESLANLNIFPVDDLVSHLRFNIDFTTHAASDLIKINSVKQQLLLKKTGETDITLEEFIISTGNYPIVGGAAQNIDFTQDRVFKIPAEIRKSITIERNYTLDSGNVYYYDLQYPFMQRWEYWSALTGLTAIPTGVFDSTKSLNGINNFWHRFNTLSGWEFVSKVTFNIHQNGYNFNQSFSSVIIDNTKDDWDFNSNAQWGNESIKSYNSLAVEVTSGGNKYLIGYEDTTIKANFEKVSGAIPSVNNVGIVIWIETFELGGISDIRRISSFYELDSNSWFKSSDTSNKVVITKVGNVFTGTCLVDYTKLPSNTKFTIYARIYEFYNPNAKQFQQGDDFEFMNGDLYEFQST